MQTSSLLFLFFNRMSKRNFRREPEKGVDLSSRRIRGRAAASTRQPYDLAPHCNRSVLSKLLLAAPPPVVLPSRTLRHVLISRLNSASRSIPLPVHRRFPFFRIPIVFQKNFLQASANRPNRGLELSPNSFHPFSSFSFFSFMFLAELDSFNRIAK